MYMLSLLGSLALPSEVPSLPAGALHPYGMPPVSAVPHDECGVVLALPCEDSVEVFALGADRALRHRRRTKGSWSTDWKPITLPGNMLGGPAATTDGAGRLHLMALGPDRKLWHTQQSPPNGTTLVELAALAASADGLVWSPWKHAGDASALSSPTLTVGTDGRLHALVLGENKGVWHAVVPLCCNAPWQWENLGGLWASRPAAVVDASGSVHVFAIGTDGAMWTTRQPPPAAAAQAAAALVQGDLAAFDAHSARAQAEGAAAWTPWASLGGRFASEPKISALRQEEGGLAVMARSATRGFAQSTYAPAKGEWSAWHALPGGPWASGPAVLPDARGGMALAARAADLAIWHVAVGADGAAPQKESLGGRFSTGPAIMEDTDGRLEVFARGFDQQVWTRKQLPSGGWAPWHSLGGDFLPFPC